MKTLGIQGTRKSTISARPDLSLRFSHRTSRTCVAAEADKSSESDGIESRFAEELKRRQANVSSSQPTIENEVAEPTAAPPRRAYQEKESLTPQLDLSRKLNSEGLEGLIPRASVLLRLGGTFFLGFLPLLAVVSLLFTGLYLVASEVAPLPKSKVNMRLVPIELSQELTGYGKNAVTPVCSATKMPIIMSDKIAALDGHFFLGAGEVDLKVGMPASAFIEAFKESPLYVIPCTK